MRKHLRRMIPLGLVSLTAGLVAIMLTGTAGLAATQAPPDATATAHDRRHARGRARHSRPARARGRAIRPTTTMPGGAATLTAGAARMISGAGRADVRPEAGRPGQHASRRVTAQNADGRATATSVPTAVIRAAATPPPPPAANACDKNPPVASELKLPERLSIAGQQVSPAVIGGSTETIVARFRITACNGKPVQGALVYVTAVPVQHVLGPARGDDGERRLGGAADEPAPRLSRDAAPAAARHVRARTRAGQQRARRDLEPPAGLVPGRPQPLGEVDRQEPGGASRRRPCIAWAPDGERAPAQSSCERDSQSRIPPLEPRLRRGNP